MVAPPKKVYWMTSTGPTLGHREKGGGLFSTLTGMDWRILQMRRKGRTVELYQGTVTWELVNDGGSPQED